MKEVILIPSYEPDSMLIDVVNSIDLKRFDVIVINDGSSRKYKKYFDEIKDKAHVISYSVNKGKGYALKIGLSYIKDKYKDNYIVITMDSDGQHKIDDAIKLSNYVKKHLYTYTLGKRKRNENTPIRSKIGNRITKMVYYFATGVNVYDTQTGLRAFSCYLTDFLLNVDGERFEYEMNALLLSPKNGIKLHEIEIETVYYNKNKGTHFNAFKDSFLIYRDIIKFSFSSLISFSIDYLLFGLFGLVLDNIVLCNVYARIVSSIINYTLNRKYVFNSSNSIYRTIFSYFGLAIIILSINCLLLKVMVYNLLINKFVAKILIEIVLFLLSFTVQQRFIFRDGIYYVKKDSKKKL